MSRFALVPLCSLPVLLALGCSSSPVAPPVAPQVEEEIIATLKGGERREAITIRAKVEKIDHESRRVSLLGHDGTRETLTAGPEVRNLDQVERGDEVVVTYFLAAAFEVLAPGETGNAGVAEGLAAAEKGEMPGGLAATEATFVVDVLKVDPVARTAVIRNTDGDVATVDVRNPVAFEKVKVGDRVQIRLTEAMAVDVQRARGGS